MTYIHTERDVRLSSVMIGNSVPHHLCEHERDETEPKDDGDSASGIAGERPDAKVRLFYVYLVHRGRHARTELRVVGPAFAGFRVRGFRARRRTS